MKNIVIILIFIISALGCKIVQKGGMYAGNDIHNYIETQYVFSNENLIFSYRPGLLMISSIESVKRIEDTNKIDDIWINFLCCMESKNKILLSQDYFITSNICFPYKLNKYGEINEYDGRIRLYEICELQYISPSAKMHRYQNYVNDDVFRIFIFIQYKNNNMIKNFYTNIQLQYKINSYLSQCGVME